MLLPILVLAAQKPLYRPIVASPTGVAAFVGTVQLPEAGVREVGSYAAFRDLYVSGAMSPVVRDFFANGGAQAWIVPLAGDDYATALQSLHHVPFDLLSLPPAPGAPTPQRAYRQALALCARKQAMLLVDPPLDAKTPADVLAFRDSLAFGEDGCDAALYFPALKDGDVHAPSGAVAGIYARTDAAQGVWKAPAGTVAGVVTAGLASLLDESQSAALDAQGVDTFRTLSGNTVALWGARTMRGADSAGDEFKYVPVRRTARLIESSILGGTAWTAIHPAGEPLWSARRKDVAAFMQRLFRKGAFQGTAPAQAYFVKCDADTNTTADVAQRRVNLLVGFAPLRAAEFVVLRLSLKAQGARGP